ncbi:MAG: phosphomannomutase/phosphoglucomutase [Candidatus Aenigmarchaeota archaeon]|nr:phosphomannomutase/phosphoglucomutase [Candidatus Aenigmarchaeota archaeon]
MNENIFRKYDIRGVVGKDFSISDAEKVGAAFGTVLKGKKLVSVGMDVRLSSESLKKELMVGLKSTGCNVIYIGTIPTPLLYFSMIRDKTDAGVMITASHNPSEYNGFKFRKKSAMPFHYRSILKMRRIIEKGKFIKGKEGKVEKKGVIEDYLKFVKDRINLGKKLKVVVDAGNGTCGEIFPRLLDDLGCKVIKLYCKPDGRFPNHIPDPAMDETLTDLRKKVVETKSDIGIAFDNDGDRIGFIDEKGNIIRNDIAMIFLTKDILKKYKKPRIVHEVKFSRMFIEYVKKNGGIPVMSKVGYPNIVSKMLKKKSHLGGELSGHFYFSENNYYEDGIFSGAKFVEYLSNQNKKFSELVKPFLKYMSSEELRVPCPDEKKQQVVKKIKSSFKSKGYKIITIDGVRVEFKDGWGLIRPSNTEPELSVRFEATTKERLHQISDIILTELKKYG